VQIAQARSVAALPDGGFLYADYGHQIVRRVSPTGVVTTVAGGGTSTADGALAVQSRLLGPVSVAVLPNGGFLVTDYDDARVRVVSPGTAQTATMSTIAGTGTQGNNGNQGVATSLEVNHPLDAQPLADGRVLIADTYNNAIRLLSAAAPGATETTIAGGGTCADASASCEGTPAGNVALNHPVAVSPIAGGASGYLIAEAASDAIRKISDASPNGSFSTVAGISGKFGFSGDGGPAASATLNHPAGVLSTADGGFLISDTSNERIRQVSPSGTIRTVAGSGAGGWSGDGGAATAAGLLSPAAVSPTADGGFLIADWDNGAIRQVTIPAVSSIAVEPVVPNGQHGWYTTPVHLTVSATLATETRCLLDPGGVPPAFDALPSTPVCAYRGSGSDITADGSHTLYAASVNQYGDKELPIATPEIMIDTTPPVVQCLQASPTYVAGTTPTEPLKAYVWDGVSLPVAPEVSAFADTSVLGQHAVTLTGTNNAGLTASVNCPYNVIAATFNPAPDVTRTFEPVMRCVARCPTNRKHGAAKPVKPTAPVATPKFVATNKTTVHRPLGLTVTIVPPGATVTVACHGGGCSFKTIQCNRLRCPPIRVKPARRGVAAPAGADLSRLFAHRQLAFGVKLTISITKPNTVGLIWSFTLRGRKPPKETVACLLPGSSIPGYGCAVGS
jgi:hypothetical protein